MTYFGNIPVNTDQVEEPTFCQTCKNPLDVEFCPICEEHTALIGQTEMDEADDEMAKALAVDPEDE
jgi:hypothetical protein